MALTERCASPSCRGIDGPVGRYGVCLRCCLPIPDETVGMSSLVFDDVHGRPIGDHADLPDIDAVFPDD